MAAKTRRAPAASRDRSLALESSLRMLHRAGGRVPRPAAVQAPAVEFPACAPPDTRTPPQFVIPYRQAVKPFTPARGGLEPSGGGASGKPTWHTIPTLACVKLELEPHLVLDLQFEQTWNLLKLGIGDLSSTLTLAPSETLTLEFQSSQRKLLEQSTTDSAEQLDSTESTKSDKEVVNVANSASKTENWKVDGSGSFSLGFVKLGAGASTSTTVSNTSQSSMQHVTEATQKSAHSLKTLHKVEVRGVTESIIQNRQTRVIKNPYPDRTLALNIFQLVKHFSVQTRLTEIRPAVVIEIKHMGFDDSFVLGNTDFLKDKLLDPSLIDELPLALLGARPFVSTGALARAQESARLALRYLFEVGSVFHMSDVHKRDGIPIDLGNPNPPATSFDAQGGDRSQSGLEDALRNQAGALFTVLNVFYAVYREMETQHHLDDHAIELATALATDLTPRWQALEALKQGDNLVINNLLDGGDFTEVFRRAAAFLAMVAGIVQPQTSAADDENKARAAFDQAAYPLERLIKHLECNEHYYIQAFLLYSAAKTHQQSILDLATDVLASMPGIANLPTRFQVERAFIDRRQIIIPASDVARDAQLAPFLQQYADGDAAFDPASVAAAPFELQVPCDGIHLEVAQGGCVLKDLPAPATAPIPVPIPVTLTGAA